MIWVAISGSWRLTAPGMEDDVRGTVTAVLAAGKAIVTGGALGTDYWAADTALELAPGRLMVILPVTLDTYLAHYQRRASEGVIRPEQAAALTMQLRAVAQAGALTEHPDRPQIVDTTAYYLRDQDIIDQADELYAFQVNDSAGTKDTIDRARRKGIPVIHRAYYVATS